MSGGPPDTPAPSMLAAPAPPPSPDAVPSAAPSAGPPPAATTATASGGKRRRNGAKGRLLAVQGWITVAIAVGALVLSLLNWVQLNSRPELDVTLPRGLRVAQHTDGLTITIQPALTVRKKSDVTTVVQDVRLLAEPLGGQSPSFRWVDVAAFVNNPQTRVPDWTYLADAAPLIVTQEEPQLPFLRFVTDDRLAAGEWRMTLEAVQDGRAPIARPFCITILPEDRTYLDGSGAEYIFRTDRPLRAGQHNADCYRV